MPPHAQCAAFQSDAASKSIITVEFQRSSALLKEAVVSGNDAVQLHGPRLNIEDVVIAEGIAGVDHISAGGVGSRMIPVLTVSFAPPLELIVTLLGVSKTI